MSPAPLSKEQHLRVASRAPHGCSFGPSKAFCFQSVRFSRVRAVFVKVVQRSPNTRSTSGFQGGGRGVGETLFGHELEHHGNPEPIQKMDPP